MAQQRSCFSWIVIAVVIEENYFTADLLLQPPGCLDFRDQESLGKKSTRLLAKTYDW
jgi:hypothetical protein